MSPAEMSITVTVRLADADTCACACADPEVRSDGKAPCCVQMICSCDAPKQRAGEEGAELASAAAQSGCC